MNILIHTRIRDLFETTRATLQAQLHRVDGAFSFAEGKMMMLTASYDKVFLGIGVPSHDRLALIALAGELGMSMIEIIDADTVTKELAMHSPTSKHPSAPGGPATAAMVPGSNWRVAPEQSAGDLAP